jgi:2-oxoglutarate ferredoxin oxidoreductase subunit beta
MYNPEFPEVVGVFRSVKKPTYEDLLDGQIAEVIAKKGRAKVEDLFKAEDIWTVS